MAAKASESRRLLVFLRPHWWRMAGNIVCNVIGAALDAFVFTLLIPFLSKIFHQPEISFAPGWLGDLQKNLIGSFIVPGDALGSLNVLIIAIVVIVVAKNVFLWLAGQLGASLQEYVTRDLRDAVFRHMQRLPLGYFHSTKVGQIIAKVLTDTDQTKNIVTELVTKTIQNLAQVVVTIVVLVRLSPKLALL